MLFNQVINRSFLGKSLIFFEFQLIFVHVTKLREAFLMAHTIYVIFRSFEKLVSFPLRLLIS